MKSVVQSFPYMLVIALASAGCDSGGESPGSEWVRLGTLSGRTKALGFDGAGGVIIGTDLSGAAPGRVYRWTESDGWALIGDVPSDSIGADSSC